MNTADYGREPCSGFRPGPQAASRNDDLALEMKLFSPAQGLWCPVHAVVDEFIDYCGVGQGCDIPEGIVLVGGDLAENSPHDLAGAGLRQTRRPLQQVGSGNRADLLSHPGDEFAPQLLARGLITLKVT